MTRNLNDISTYFLMLELHNDGTAGLLPSIEPISEKEIFEELQSRTGLSENTSIEEWDKWFLSQTEYASELERTNFLIFLQTNRKMQEI